MTSVDRPAAIRRVLRDLVAERGFHGASMSAVAKAAGVAAGTAYVHYASKDDLIIATYLEIKTELAAAVLADHDGAADALEQYRHVLKATYRHMVELPERAKFLTQIEGSPYRAEAHVRFMERGDALVEALYPLVADRLRPLPVEVISAMSLGLVVQLVASGIELTDPELDELVEATWCAITT